MRDMGKRRNKDQKDTPKDSAYLSEDFAKANQASAHPWEKDDWDARSSWPYENRKNDNKPGKVASTSLADFGKPASTYVPKCTAVHAGKSVAIDVDGKQICGAAYSRLETTGAKLVIDLCGLVTQAPIEFVKSKDSRWDTLRGFKPKRPPILTLEWKDYGVPYMPVGFWRELWRLIPFGKTIICCQGSHGRTGTAMAALLVANGVTARDAIDYVRKHHCDWAVETGEQEDYLYELEEEAKEATP